MSSEQRISTLTDARLAAIADRTAELKAQLFELECLRDRLGQALRQPEKHRNRTAVVGVGAKYPACTNCPTDISASRK
jgi:hypothetical protein